ncbi:MAG TPA: MBL fold metallo-hydrolase [Polyangiaceae bacterium]|nr:MBL fold metallo-hydrolase [Polyangiaceae bacterium]
MPQRFPWLQYGALAALAIGCNRAEKQPKPSPTPQPPAVQSAAKTGAVEAGAALAAADSFETTGGPVNIHPLQHATFFMDVAGKIVWLDPAGEKTPGQPKADVILISDIHGDHLDAKAVERLKKTGTRVLGPRAVAEQLPGTDAIANGETRDLGFMKVEAVPMYNLKRGPAPGKLFHDKGRGNGYVLSVGDKRVYVSGDTECIPEMKALRSIDVAFVCMNVPYTMPPNEAAECVRAFRPKVLYPYHYRGSNLEELDTVLAGTGVDVRKRNWY